MKDTKKILVIDDSETIRNLLKDGLEEAGYAVRTAETVEAGVQLMDVEVPHVVVMDVNLPGDCQGDEATHVLKMSPAGREIPFILISDMAADRLKRLALDCYAEGYLKKPFEPAELLLILEALFERP